MHGNTLVPFIRSCSAHVLPFHTLSATWCYMNCSILCMDNNNSIQLATLDRYCTLYFMCLNIIGCLLKGETTGECGPGLTRIIPIDYYVCLFGVLFLPLPFLLPTCTPHCVLWDCSSIQCSPVGLTQKQDGSSNQYIN